MKKQVLLALAIYCSSLAQAEIWHALVLGANKYESDQFTMLYGAVNDAELIAKSLQQQGVHPTLLINNEISYDAVRNWWKKTLNDLAPGDVVFFSFAGHGARQPEQFPGSEAANAKAEGLVDAQNSINKDTNNPLSSALQLDEVLVLPGYRNEGAASRERLVDNELMAWFKAATDKGATVIAVADACYGGGMVRSALSGRDYSDSMAAVRNSGGDILDPEDKTLRGSAESARLRASNGEAFSNRLFYAIPSDKETEQVTEMIIDDKAHGLLSFLMAQALAGNAKDKNGKALKSARDIRFFLQNKSRLHLDKGQIVFLIGVNNKNKDLVLMPGADAAETSLVEEIDKKPTPFSVFVDGNCTDTTDGDSLYHWVNNPQTAAFRWSCDTGRVVKSGVGVVAYDISDVGNLKSFLRRQVLIHQIQALSLPHFRGAILPAGQTDLAETSIKVFEENDDVSIYFSAPSDFDTVFALNLPSKGDIQFIQAVAVNALQHLPKRATNADFDTLLGTTTVTPPFGNDYLLLIAMSRETAMQTAFFHNLLKSGKLPSKLDASAELLLTLQNFAPQQAGLSIIPFASVRP